MKKTIKMVLERETKGAVRYMEVDASGNQLELQDSTIGTLYIRKTALGVSIPNPIFITITDSYTKKI